MEAKKTRRGAARAWILGALVLAGLGVGAFFLWKHLHGDKDNGDPQKREVIVTDKAVQANNRGIGFLEQFKYDEAVKPFEEAIKEAPGWVAPRINLALALLNHAGKITPNSDQQRKEVAQLFQRAVDLFEEIIDKEEDKKWHTYAHYGIGVIRLTQGRPNDVETARRHLAKAAELDPEDPHILFRYAETIRIKNPKEAAEAANYLRKALERDPFLGGAINAYSLNRHVRDTEGMARVKEMQGTFERLGKSELLNSARDRYSELGFYGEAIGRVPPQEPRKDFVLPVFLQPDKLKVQLDTGTRWATASDYGDGKKDDPRSLIATLGNRCGGTFVLFDHDADGKTDVLLLAAIVRGGKLGDLLLRQEGDGAFQDVTEKAGLAAERLSTACSVGDFDNDGAPDLFLSTARGVRLFRNKSKGQFEDVTEKAHLDRFKGICTASGFVDIDQDGDLDVLLCASPAEDYSEAGLRQSLLVLLINTGEAKPKTASDNPPPLEPSFVEQAPKAFKHLAAPCLVGIADLDLDNGLDVVALPAAREVPEAIFNERLLRFTRAPLPAAPKDEWRGMLVLDVNQDGKSDLLLLGKQELQLLVHKGRQGPVHRDKLFDRVAAKSPALLQAQVIDLDLDGWPDVVGLTEQHVPVVLHNHEGTLVLAETGLGGKTVWGTDILAFAAADLNGDGRPDLIGWSASKGLQILMQQENKRHGLQIRLSGQRRIDAQNGGEFMRCNADGIGVRVIAQAGTLHTTLENSTLFSGLGQSRVPLTVGLGHARQADVIRLRWPDNCWQAEFSLASGKAVVINETNRKPTSCPILFTWNGERFVFVTDFLGAGTMGEMTLDGSTRPPRPEESVKIEAHQLKPRDGEFIFKIAEPMDEVTYLDRLQLLVVDHPDSAHVFPDERLATSEPAPTQDLFAFDRKIHPALAKNRRGKDITKKILATDRDAVDEFAWRSWLGFAEEHWVELDFGDQLRGLKPDTPIVLCLAGWTEYAYPESIWAANQAGVAMLPPVLEMQTADGKWKKVADIGFPAGMPRVMTYDLTGKLQTNGKIRLCTNLQIFWDEISLGIGGERVPAAMAPGTHRLCRVTPLEVTKARLYERGIMQEYTPDGRLPILYDHDRLSATPVNRLKGNLTRLGDVTELLHDADDRFVLIGPGDEMEVRIDARKLPALQPGWKRSYVLKTWGYCKDTGPFTATSTTIEPLPFRAMKKYPPGPDEKNPDTPLHREYLQKYNTRRVGE